MTILNSLGALKTPMVNTVVSGWLGIFDRTTSNSGDLYQHAVVDSFGNVFVVANTESTTYQQSGIHVIKFNNVGEVIWQRKLLTQYTPSFYNNIILDNSGDVVIFSVVGNTSSAFTSCWKLSATDGSTILSKTLNYGVAGEHFVVKDSSGNFFIMCGYQNTIVKLSSTFQVLASKTMPILNFYTYVGITIDNNDNIILAGPYIYGSGFATRVIKFNNSLSVLWSNHYYNNTRLDGCQYPCVDSSDNIYLRCGFTGSGTAPLTIVKLNSSGVVQWVKEYGSNIAGNNFPVKMYEDSMYVLFSVGRLIKIDSTNGTVYWDTKFDTDYRYDVVLDNTKMYSVGWVGTTSTAQILITQFPANGRIPRPGSYTVGSFTINYTALSLPTVVDSTIITESFTETVTTAAPTIVDLTTTNTVITPAFTKVTV